MAVSLGSSSGVSMSLCILLITVFVGVASSFYVFLKHLNRYWRNRNVLCEDPILFFGNMKGIGTEFHLMDLFDRTYRKFKGKAPFAGFYLFFKPVAIVLDVDLAKNIMIKDFNNFADRGQFVNEVDDPLTGHLFSLEGAKWRSLRQKLTPAFSSGKMKMMFPIVRDIGDRLSATLVEYVSNDAIVDVKDINARFTMDVIGTCGFGVECNSLKDDNAEFLRVGRKFFSTHRHNPIVEGFQNSYPKLAAKLRMKLIPDDISEFFINVVRETVAYRETNNVKRNDFMDILLELRNTKVTLPNGEQTTSLTFEEMAAQVFVIFLAGFETSSSTMSFCLYELALNPDIQEKLRSEIHDVLKANGGHLTYEAMNDLKYTDQVISETLRKYPIVPSLVRVARDDYKVPGSELVIEKGTLTFIPAYSIQHDAENFPNPQKFDPGRFSPEEIKKRAACAWLPFGDGPRNCIGMRFGRMQARIGLVHLLKDFQFMRCEKTEEPLIFDRVSFVLSTVNGIYLRAEKV